MPAAATDPPAAAEPTAEGVPQTAVEPAGAAQPAREAARRKSAASKTGSGGGQRGTLTSARSKARRAALELLFEADQRGLNAADLLADRTAHPVAEQPPRPYTCAIVQGVVDRWARIDEALSTYSQGWTLDRMPAVDRALLRLAAWEVLFNDEVPDGVAISEAVALATELSTAESPTFVNGLLSRIAEVKSTLI